jgi:peptide/nickel transport system permease protein
MFAYVMRKLIFMPFILLGVVALTFLLFTISTRPEALATIQLGEKASPRQKYEWLESKGFINWTERGTEKLGRMERAELPTRTTQLFNASLLEDMAETRDRLARQKEEISAEPESEERTADLAALEEKIFKNKTLMLAAIRGAQAIQVMEAVGLKQYAEGRHIDDLVHTFEDARAALKAAEESGKDVGDAKAALEAAQQEMNDAIAASGENLGKYRTEVKAAEEGIAKVEDIPPDLEYTSRIVMFWHYLGDLATLDFGDTRTGRPVSQVLWQGMGPSLSLALPAFLLSELIALFFGLLAAMYRKTRLDATIVISSIILMSINGIALIIAGQKFMASDWNYFPIAGYAGGLGAARFLLLPAFLYVVLSFGEHVRFNRIVMLDEVGQDYVRTARAKGLNENSVLFKHVFRNSLIPLITRWTVAIPTLYTGSLILESFFGIPGLGYLTVDAIANSDGNVIRAIVVIGAVSFMLANLLADVLYAVVDPRIRLG